MSKMKLNLSQEDLDEIVKILEAEVDGYSLIHPPERITRLREAIKQLKS
jgi:hypothetical protein